MGNDGCVFGKKESPSQGSLLETALWLPYLACNKVFPWVQNSQIQPVRLRRNRRSMICQSAASAEVRITTAARPMVVCDQFSIVDLLGKGGMAYSLLEDIPFVSCKKYTPFIYFISSP